MSMQSHQAFFLKPSLYRRTLFTFLFFFLFLSFQCSKDYQGLFNEAMELKRQGKYDEYLSKLQEAAQKKETAEVYKEMGNYYISYAVDYDKAEELLNKSLAIDPNYANAIHNLGLVYLKRYEKDSPEGKKEKYLDQADKWFSKNLSKNPDFGLSYAEYAMVLMYRHKNKDALENIKIAQQKGANFNYLSLLEGKIYYYGFQDYENAIKSFNIAYNDFSKDPYLLKLMAYSYKKLKQPQDAHLYYIKYEKSLEESGAPSKIIEKAKSEEAEFGS